MLRFLKRLLMQEVWLLLLDEEFMQAYRHGILIMCGDKVLRRLFPRFYFYIADYPEKYVSHLLLFLFYSVTKLTNSPESFLPV